MLREVIFLLVVTLHAILASPAPCKDNGKCGCDVKDAANNTVLTIDLNKLTSSDPAHPQYNVTANYIYYFNPCKGMNIGNGCGTKDDSAACQQTTDKKTRYNIGRTDKLSFSLTDDGIIQAWFPTNPSDPNARQSFYLLMCQRGLAPPTLQYIKEDPPGHYRFTMKGEMFCRPGEGHSSKSATLSIGSILLICLLCVLVLYLTIGIAYKRMHKGATGLEMIPNRDFWAGLPSLIRDGACMCCGDRGSGGKMRYEKL